MSVYRSMLELTVLQIFIGWLLVGCAAKEIAPVEQIDFDGRWQAEIISFAVKRTGSAGSKFECQRKLGKTLNFTVRDGKGSVITGWPASAKGTVKSDGTFRFKTLLDHWKNSYDEKITREFILSGSLVEMRGKHSLDIPGTDSGCDYQVSITKVADRIRWN